MGSQIRESWLTRKEKQTCRNGCALVAQIAVFDGKPKMTGEIVYKKRKKGKKERGKRKEKMVVNTKQPKPGMEGQSLGNSMIRPHPDEGRRLTDGWMDGYTRTMPKMPNLEKACICAYFGMDTLWIRHSRNPRQASSRTRHNRPLSCMLSAPQSYVDPALAKLPSQSSPRKAALASSRLLHLVRPVGIANCNTGRRRWLLHWIDPTHKSSPIPAPRPRALLAGVSGACMGLAGWSKSFRSGSGCQLVLPDQ